MTKTRMYGVQIVAPTRRYITSRFKNGTAFNAEYASTPSWNRRIGVKSTLTGESGKDGRFRPCLHKTVKYFPVTSVYGGESITNQFVKAGGGSASSTLSCVTDGFDQVCMATAYPRFLAFSEPSLSLSAVQWDGLAAVALGKMLPSFYTGFSLPNFLFELKDFKHIALAARASVLGRKTNIIAALLGMKGTGNRALRPDQVLGKRTMKQLSQAYLSYNFGWAPLFSDIRKFFESWINFRERWSKMIANEGKPRTTRYRQYVDGTAFSGDIPESGEPTFGGWSGVLHRRGRYEIHRIKNPGIQYAATMRYRYKLPSDIHNVGRQMDALFDALGLQSGNPAAVWNAIPFTFVIDWFVNIGGFLERLRTDNIQIQTEILDFCHSAKIERKVVLWWQSQFTQVTGPDSYNYYYGNKYATDVCVSAIYERRVGLPNIRNALLGSGLNFREFLLSGALLMSNRK